MTADPDERPANGRRGVAEPRLLGSSTVMAAGTVVSRLTGVLRAMVVAAALGLTGVTADTFNIPNVIPNTIYILVGGGILNSVLVPAMVRAIKNDADQGEAYSQRLFSLVVTVLGVATAAAVAAAPWLIGLFVSPEYQDGSLEPFLADMVLFARFCLPQIFFYGLYVLLGQMLNARNRFGPMMWAPILNNVVAIAVFGAYILTYGAKFVAGDVPEPFTDTEVLLLGLGSTVGVALQALILVPVLRRTGFRIRFRTDWRGSGLGTAGRLGLWTLAFVLVNQVAYIFVVRTASGGAAGAVAADATAAGYTVYANAMLILMVPHSVVTVSLATALLPRLSDHAADGRYELARDQLLSAIKVCLAVIAPLAIVLAATAEPLAALFFDYGAAQDDTGALAVTLIAMLPGLVAFTVHYLVLRGFYALQDTRTPFLVQIWVAATLVVNALIVSSVAASENVTVLLAAGYSIAYLIGAIVSFAALARRLGGLAPRTVVTHLAKLVLPAGLAGGVAYALVRLVGPAVGGFPGWLGNLVTLAVAAPAGLVTFAVTGYTLRIEEVREAVKLLYHRIRSQSRAGRA